MSQIYTVENLELYHYGVKGMKWGVRRYQPYGHGGYNPDNPGRMAGDGTTNSSSGGGARYGSRKNKKVKKALKIAAGVAGAAALAGGTAYLIKSGKGKQAIDAARRRLTRSKAPNMLDSASYMYDGVGRRSGALASVKNTAANLRSGARQAGSVLRDRARRVGGVAANKASKIGNNLRDTARNVRGSLTRSKAPNMLDSASYMYDGVGRRSGALAGVKNTAANLRSGARQVGSVARDRARRVGSAVAGRASYAGNKIGSGIASGVSRAADSVAKSNTKTKLKAAAGTAAIAGGIAVGTKAARSAYRKKLTKQGYYKNLRNKNK